MTDHNPNKLWGPFFVSQWSRVDDSWRQIEREALQRSACSINSQLEQVSGRPAVVWYWFTVLFSIYQAIISWTIHAIMMPHCPAFFFFELQLSIRVLIESLKQLVSVYFIDEATVSQFVCPMNQNFSWWCRWWLIALVLEKYTISRRRKIAVSMKHCKSPL